MKGLPPGFKNHVMPKKSRMLLNQRSIQMLHVKGKRTKINHDYRDRQL